MSIGPIAFVALLALSVPALTAQGATVAGTDHPIVGRFDGSRLVGYEHKCYGSRAFVTGGTPYRSLVAADLQSLEGKSTILAYDTMAGRTLQEIVRNFQASLKATGLTGANVCENHEGQRKRCTDSKQIAQRAAPLGSAVVEHGQCFKNRRYGLYRKGAELTVALHVGDCFAANTWH
jgi:hypothetical protein